MCGDTHSHTHTHTHTHTQGHTQGHTLGMHLPPNEFSGIQGRGGHQP